MANSNVAGNRLLVSQIDYIAKTEPDRKWAIQAITNEPITFSRLATLVDNAAWWLQQVLPPSKPLDAFAYQGPNDIRVPILTLAAAKVGRQIFLPIPSIPSQVREQLVHKSNCVAFLHASGVTIESAAPTITVPDVTEWSITSRSFPYEKTFDLAKDEPWIILHTTGTTGPPKLLYLNQTILTCHDAETLITAPWLKEGDCILSASPLMHWTALSPCLQFPAFLGAVYILPAAPVTVESIAETLEKTHIDVAIFTPALIEGLVKKHSDKLKKLKAIAYGGAPLKKHIGDNLNSHINVLSAIGMTEAGPFIQCLRQDHDWDYLSFATEMGLSFEEFSNDIYEMVFVKNPAYSRYQQVFMHYPEKQEYRSGDLYEKHPSKDAWKYVGRIEGFINLSNGSYINCAAIESALTNDARIEGALVGGSGRDRPFLILFLQDGYSIDDVWSHISEVNQLAKTDTTSISRSLTMQSDHKRPAVRSGKGELARMKLLELYREDIEELYANLEK